MRITKLRLKNWKNFADVNVPLSPRTFIIGNNGTGKSNMLDALRFLRDIANPKGGGLQAAMEKRGGMKQTRSFFARKSPLLKVGVDIEDLSADDGVSIWSYDISLKQETSGNRRILLESEHVKKDGKEILRRPDKADKEDPQRLTQTALEQTIFNKQFRSLVDFFCSIKYLHIVPQLIRHGDEIQGKVVPEDPFGQGLMQEIARSDKRRQNSYLREIGASLGKIKPAFAKSDTSLKFERDEKTGKPHLRFKHPDWRSNDSWQNEEILSDGELRLVGLLWTLMASSNVALLEEPELSFNEKLVESLPRLFDDIVESKKKKKDAQQIILTTHSHALLSDEGITSDEIIMLRQGKETTEVIYGPDSSSVANDMKAGLPAAKAVLPLVQSGI